MNEHHIVYSEKGMYAGWPANHGAWQWGDEMLVGFLRGKYQVKSMHHIAEPFQKMLARSLDGGRTWKLEKPNEDFNCIWEPEPAPSFVLDDVIIRVCGVYDHGGDECYEPGGFYLSRDRGHFWEGPYKFTGLEKEFASGVSLNTSRTRVHNGLVYLSRGNPLIWGTDETFCAWYDGNRFQMSGMVLSDGARAVMPAVAQIGERRIAVMRRRRSGNPNGWIEACASDDGGETWAKLSWVGDTGGRNGNPPALVALNDGRLLCVYGNRDYGSITFSISDDVGETWRSGLVRAGNEDHKDIGYPQLLLREDGTPVVIYYWSEVGRRHQHIVATEIKDL